VVEAHTHTHTTHPILFYVLSLGWLAKLWECAGTKGLIIVTGKDRWTAEALKNDIKDDRVKLIEETKACTRTVTSWQLLQ
jgi:hypothetical protein